MAAKRQIALTLMELIVVMVIILLLIGLLLPAIGAMRRKSQESDTRNQLMAISAACEGYFSVFRAYLGPMVEERLTADMGWTGSQNLTLGILGSIWTPVWPATPQVTPTFDDPSNYRSNQWGTVALPPAIGGRYVVFGSEQPRGVYDLADGVWHASFYTPRAGEARVPEGVAPPTSPMPNTTRLEHARVPVLFDRFRDGLPILYYRRDTTFVSPVAADSYITPGVGQGAAYYRLSNAAYTNAASLRSNVGTLKSQATSGYNTANSTTAVKTPFSTHFEEVVTDLTSDYSTPSSRKPRNMFVLISAGLDGVYGPRIENGAKVAESDDIVVVGGGSH